MKDESFCLSFNLHPSSFILSQAEGVGVEPTGPCGDGLANRCITSSAHPSVLPHVRPVEPRGVEPRRRACKAQLSPASDPVSDLGGNRTHTPRGSRLSTDSGYLLQHEVSGPGGSRTLTPVTAPVSETGVTTSSTTRPIALQLQTRELNPASRLMRPERAPARLQCIHQ